MKTPTTDRWRYRKSGQHGFPEEQFTGHPALAAAIVRQAVEDYREAERLERGEIHYSSLGIYCPAQTKKEIVRFFRSQWYGILCDIDPERIIKKLKEEEHERY